LDFNYYFFIFICFLWVHLTTYIWVCTYINIYVRESKKVTPVLSVQTQDKLSNSHEGEKIPPCYHAHRILSALFCVLFFFLFLFAFCWNFVFFFSSFWVVCLVAKFIHFKYIKIRFKNVFTNLDGPNHKFLKPLFQLNFESI
jgi:hypothetical protein